MNLLSCSRCEKVLVTHDHLLDEKRSNGQDTADKN